MGKKSFNEKLMDSKDMPKVIELTDPKSINRYGGHNMLIAPPLAYDEIMREIPIGKLMTSDYARDYLAKKAGADFTCPLTAGIFINIAARASEEREDDKTPYWRMLKKDGELNEKFPGGIDNHKFLLETEGHVIIKKGKRYFVENYKERFYEIAEE